MKFTSTNPIYTSAPKPIHAECYSRIAIVLQNHIPKQILKVLDPANTLGSKQKRGACHSHITFSRLYSCPPTGGSPESQSISSLLPPFLDTSSHFQSKTL